MRKWRVVVRTIHAVILDEQRLQMQRRQGYKWAKRSAVIVIIIIIILHLSIPGDMAHA
jgi:hypothetical protein